MRCNAPPRGVSSIPRRIKTVLIPASLAVFVPFSQSLHTSEIKSHLDIIFKKAWEKTVPRQGVLYKIL